MTTSSVVIEIYYERQRLLPKRIFKVSLVYVKKKKTDFIVILIKKISYYMYIQ